MKKKIITFMLYVAAVMVNAQNSDNNYILSRTYLDKNSTKSIDVIKYFDGLGRHVQTVQKGITPTGNDLTNYIEYDISNQVSKTYLPVVTGDDGHFISVSDISSSSFYNDARAFSETEYDALGRPIQTKSPGVAWTDHPSNIEYQTNSSDEVKYYYIDINNQLVCSGTYPASSLSKGVVKDEDGKSATEYKDNLGHVIMQRCGNVDFADTYYVYNDLGQLAYVIPPSAVDEGINTPDVINQLCYAYQYDERGNCKYKKLPGCEPIYMVYDRADRLVLSQDGNQRTKNQWVVTKYDVFHRVIYIGTMESTTTPQAFADALKNCSITEVYNGSGDFGYTEQNYGIFTYIAPLIIKYYDNYKFVLDENLKYTDKKGFSKACTGNPDIVTPTLQDFNVKGLLTGTHIYLLDGSGQYKTTVNYYNDKGGIVQTRSTNHLNGYDITYNDLDFTGKIIKTLKEHNIEEEMTRSDLYENTYDNAGRLISINTYDFNNRPVAIVHNTYDELGRLKTKSKVGDIDQYEYNIRNWLTKVKCGDFEENLFYNTNPLGVNICYNGNISYSTWTYGSAKKGYAYEYDELNRLKNTNFVQETSSQLSGSFNEYFEYDKMGNIKTLQRKKDDKLIDDLILEYSGNQLKTVADACDSQNQHAVKEYQDKDNGQQEFGYDANGNMSKDLDRGIVMIKYNLLNLPDTIQFSTGDQIINKYNAGSEKLYTHCVTLITKLVQPLVESCIMNYSNVKDEVMITGNEYIGDMEYETNCYYNEMLQKNIYMYTPTRLYNPEGYLTLNGYPRYFAYRKDHLGNVREVWRSASESDVYRSAVVQRTQYYASGLPWAESLNAELQNRKYNGKEWIETHGYDTYDYDARGYYPAIMRFTMMDPLAEKYYSISPYAYCANNPIRFIDPDGRVIRIKSTDDKYCKETFNNLQQLTSEKLLLLKNGKVVEASTYNGKSDKIALTGTVTGNGKDKVNGSKLVHDVISDKKHTATIQSGKKNEFDPKSENDASTRGVGSSGTLSFNNESTGYVRHIYNEDGTDYVSDQSILGHELLHARHSFEGTVNYEKVEAHDPDQNNWVFTITKEELRTRKFENYIRREQNDRSRDQPRIVNR